MKKNKNGGYKLRPHSLRKFFDTTLKAHQTPDDFVQHMLGHLTDKYNIQSLGIEFLRNIYTKGGLRIKPQASLTTTDFRRKALEAPDSLRTYGEISWS